LIYLKIDIIIKIQDNKCFYLNLNFKEGYMKTNYIMGAEDVAAELGISKSHAYKVIRQLNDELEKCGYIVLAGKIPRAFWEKKFYGYQTIQTV